MSQNNAKSQIYINILNFIAKQDQVKDEMLIDEEKVRFDKVIAIQETYFKEFIKKKKVRQETYWMERIDYNKITAIHKRDIVTKYKYFQAIRKYIDEDRNFNIWNERFIPHSKTRSDVNDLIMENLTSFETQIRKINHHSEYDLTSLFNHRQLQYIMGDLYQLFTRRNNELQSDDGIDLS